MKQVEFDIELVKKIQNGEIKGTIRTRDGRKAMFMGEINNPTYPLVFVVKQSQFEVSTNYTSKGKCYISDDKNKNDIIIEIEEPKQECQFKPFDKVLGRDEDNQLWRPDIFSYYKEDDIYKYRCLGDIFKQCIPYEGNEHLLGTDKPKEE